MPGVGAELRTSVCTQGVMPAIPSEGFEIFNKPGQGEQSVLFYAPQWQPQTAVFLDATTSEAAAIAYLKKLRGFRRQFMDVSDGQTVFPNSMILGIRGTYRYAGVVVSAGLPGGAIYPYELVVIVAFLPQPS